MPVKTSSKNIAHYHLPGLFEFYELYSRFLPLFYEHREWFYDWCDIASIYGAPADCLWGGGRVGFGDNNPNQVLALLDKYNISARLTFSNSLLRPEHLSDKKCNELCNLFQSQQENRPQYRYMGDSSQISQRGRFSSVYIGDTHEKRTQIKNGVIVHSDLLLDYIRKNYPELYLVSSTTKVLTDFAQFQEELNRPEFSYVVPDFRLNKDFANLKTLTQSQKDKVEFLCNECCDINCQQRKICYENVSRKSLGENCPDHICKAPGGNNGYVFSNAMKNPAFIGIDDIQNTYLPAGFTNFKLEGRSLGSAIILEFLLYYMTKPEHQLEVRENIYLDGMLDLF